MADDISPQVTFESTLSSGCHFTLPCALPIFERPCCFLAVASMTVPFTPSKCSFTTPGTITISRENLALTGINRVHRLILDCFHHGLFLAAHPKKHAVRLEPFPNKTLAMP